MLRPCPWSQCWRCTEEQEKRAQDSWKWKELFDEVYLESWTCWPGRSWWTARWAESAPSFQISEQRWRDSPMGKWHFCGYFRNIVTITPKIPHFRGGIFQILDLILCDYLQFVSQCTCWRRAGWPPPSDRSQCRGRARRWKEACKHISSSGNRPTSCLPEIIAIMPILLVTIIHTSTLYWKVSWAMANWPWTWTLYWPTPCWSSSLQLPCSCSSWARVDFHKKKFENNLSSGKHRGRWNMIGTLYLRWRLQAHACHRP